MLSRPCALQLHTCKVMGCLYAVLQSPGVFSSWGHSWGVRREAKGHCWWGAELSAQHEQGWRAGRRFLDGGQTGHQHKREALVPVALMFSGDDGQLLDQVQLKRSTKPSLCGCSGVVRVLLMPSL